ncbi:MAG: T9SS type A sorting domain-containing protein [Schleiferiaceae bacterium]|jgi:DNA/RNA endonuclease YhcR with UshA esterase domain|nr:T9SS type A sorting domain-containing protein [Schleiferiaceae bacterium]
MKKQLLILAMFITSIAVYGQVPYVSIHDINFVSASDLSACNDTSSYDGDTVRTRGIVIIDGNLSEVPSSSVQGGARPFIHIVDTAGGGANTSWTSLEVMGVYQDASGALQVPPTFTQVVSGDLVEITGIVSAYNNGNQISLLDANSFSVLGSATPPTPVSKTVGDFNDPNRVNDLTTGEQWEGSFVKLQNVTVTEVIFFSGNRVSFNIIDGQGNKMNVSDRYLAQKLPSYQTVNPNSPQTTGRFTPPVPGTFYNSISGVIRHDGNGCTGAAGRGYEINPFDSLHYDIGFAPPYISNVERDPKIPTSSQTVDIEFNIADFDGTVDSAFFYWEDDSTKAPSQFTGTQVQPNSGTTGDYTFTIPAKPDGAYIRYYIRAVDDQGNESFYPSKPVTQTEPNVEYYFVRDNGLKIFDIQYTLDPSGASPLVGEEVTVTGIVTASTKLWDLGYLYIQDEGGSAWSGIWVVGNDIANVYRYEEVTVTGEVQENFGMTRISALNINKTGNLKFVFPTTINPQDSAGYASGEWEKWEGVYMRYEQSAGKIHVSQPNLGFGDYAVSTSNSANVANSARVLAGRQSSSSSSSLYVQVVSDTVYNNLDGQMQVTPIEANTTMNMDALEGVMYYGFSNYRLLPRNNDDFVGINVNLDTTNLEMSPLSVVEYNNSNFSYFPNPANEILHIQSGDLNRFNVQIFNMTGQMVISQDDVVGHLTLDVSELDAGAYIMHITDEMGKISTAKILKQ